MESIKLERIENDHKITRETDGKFLYEYQKAVLLALVELNRLTEMQYRYADEKLRQQYFNDLKRQSAHLSNRT